MIKLSKHLLTCDCDHCADMFPPGRFEATWSMAPRLEAHALRVRAGIPIGPPPHAMLFTLFVDPDGRLLGDWPGFPGTAGAKLEFEPGVGDEPGRVLSTADPILRGLSAEVPLRRKLVEKMNARLMVELGLAPPDTADFVPCELHTTGLPALTCRHLASAQAPLDAVLLYDLEGDFPDCFCPECLQRYAGGDVDVCVPTCSVCQQARVAHHRVIGTTWYGAPPGAP